MSSNNPSYFKVPRENYSFSYTDPAGSSRLNDWLQEDSKDMPWHNIGSLPVPAGNNQTTPASGGSTGANANQGSGNTAK
ncbi:unnamed protein product [Clonostachys byssicola]|uniref:Uncharacterized protein n=1 Tax=Clonostachys byssicola TaxID=160290 RepID=A0A9N9UEW6_9HYPO|nr:unnamed protein product [Clonostachys byssicola]